MAWVTLFVAGILEILWATGLKYTNGLSRPWPTAGTLLALAGSVALLAIAMRTLPIGTAYAVWTGIGTVGTVMLGAVLFGEPLTVTRTLCVGLILAGIAGLKMAN